MHIITHREAEERLSSDNNLLNRISKLVVEKSESEDETSEEESESEFPVLEVGELSEQDKLHAELLAQVLALPDVEKKPKTRGQRGKQIPDFIREEIAVGAHFDKNKNISAEYNVHPSMTSEFKRGHVGGKANKNLKEGIGDRLAKVRKMAESRVMKAMRLIDNESLATLNAVQLASVALSMSKVIAIATPIDPEADGKGTNVQFTVFQPQIKEEHSYKQIDVGTVKQLTS